MNRSDRRKIREEEKLRRKRLLRIVKETERTEIWNKVLDEVGPCSEDDLERNFDGPDYPAPVADIEQEDGDEGYPNRAETIHNLYECD